MQVLNGISGTYILGDNPYAVDCYVAGMLHISFKYVIDKKMQDSFCKATKWYNNIMDEDEMKNEFGKAVFCKEADKPAHPPRQEEGCISNLYSSYENYWKIADEVAKYYGNYWKSCNALILINSGGSFISKVQLLIVKLTSINISGISSILRNLLYIMLRLQLLPVRMKKRLISLLD